MDFLTQEWMHLPVWAWILILVVIVALIVILIVVSIKSKRSAKEDAEYSEYDNNSVKDKDEVAVAKEPKAEKKAEVKAEPAPKTEEKKAAPQAEAKAEVKPAPKAEEEKEEQPKAETKSTAKPATKPVAKTTKPQPKTYHISKRKEDGKWQVKMSKGAKAIKLFATQAEAIEYTKQLADNQDASIVVHKVDGSFRRLNYTKKN